MIAQTMGSEIIIPQYPIFGAKNQAINTFPASSIKLDTSGVLVSPKPCILFLKIQIIAGKKYRHPFTFKYKVAVCRISFSALPVTKRINTGERANINKITIPH